RPLAEDVVRALVLDGAWLTTHRRPLLDHVADHTGPLALTLADARDPMKPKGAVEGLRQLLAAAGRAGHRVELLRTDTTGIAFAALGGTLGAVGVLTSLRHHALPMRRNEQRQYQAQQTSPLVFLPELACWQHGAVLSALAPLDDVHLARCPCGPCAGRSLERLAEQWPPKKIPREIVEDAVRHDVACWTALAGDVLAAPDPALAWADTCAAAGRAVLHLQDRHRLELRLPAAMNEWARTGSMPSRRPRARRT
ncbi:MAG: hypothetical protein QG671_1639, partial [Actinomycetota bacterium]|nr:hypothetical protein [Actinomycetota bacterium]